ncbi:hypothetical protein [Pseudonocardia charpentierae]|uniref:SMI1 / KNR4 family (SUKH-1) n=1 Tax=Pseudonocardia charpentierae TaxID=3075545 RepID=A0ABU2N505_9PSEU|nr:hypothetical protein [Pseudonocardia sp. DSM 45834]MDT0349008.1 hypothetical protein [Pseudonocardia sp. DSM 45834]
MTTNDVAAAWRAFAVELGYPVQAGAGPASVADLVARSAVLGGAPPPEFLDLLRDQNGGEVNGLRFFPARSGRPTGGTELPDLVEVNLDMRDGGGLAEHIVLVRAASACARCTCPAERSTNWTASRWT